MQLQSHLLSLAIVSALAVSTQADAATSGNGIAAMRAKSLVTGSAAALVHRADADAFIARDTLVDANGTEHVRFERTYRGLPVIGGDFVLHSKNGQAPSTSQTLKTKARPGILPAFGAARAVTEAGARFGTDFTGVPSARLVVYARGAAPVLAYEVTFKGTRKDQTPTDMHYFVNATNGTILDQYDTVQTAIPGPDPARTCTGATAAVGTGKTLLLGNVTLNTSLCGTKYQMVDLTRGGGKTTNMMMTKSGMGAVVTDADNIFGNNLNSDAATVAADAHLGVSATWDYFKAVHARNGIANDGRGAVSRVHYGVAYANAFWSDDCFCMTFGDGGGEMKPLVALDVAGHEMSHGVTSRTANLTYSGESGGLNEATSDIFGTMVEYRVNSSLDKPDYIIGEKLYKVNPDNTKGLRVMFKPSLDGSSPDCYSANIGGMDVHYSSGVANHFFYLLAEGALVPTGFGAGTAANLTPASLVCNGNTAIIGIGRAKAEKIWYRALTVYMTSSTNYAGARAATLKAAADLYGGVGSTTYNAVAAAWSAVSVI